MAKHKTFLAAFLLLPFFLCAQSANDYTQYVNPFIGTQTDETGALSGSTFPGATMPQGMVQLSPETELMVTCFVEGNAWQYMWFVPQDPQGLIDLFGGNKGFLKKLDENFSLTATSGAVNGNASGFIGQYAHGNEPSHHTVYLYNFAGKPERTQELVEQVRSEFYRATPCGYAGNDDCGQMSAWYIFSSLGFYPFHAGSAEYVIGTPLFKKATLHLENRNDFVITAKNKTPERIHIKSVKLNGKPIKDYKITHQQIMAGGTLEFILK